MILSLDLCKMFKTVDLNNIAIMDQVTNKMEYFRITILYKIKGVQMLECWRHSIIVSSQHKDQEDKVVMIEIHQDQLMGCTTIYTLINSMDTKQIIAIIVLREQYKVWKCIYETKQLAKTDI